MTSLLGRAGGALLLITAIGCGSEDEETEGERVCSDVMAKLQECKLELPSGTRCDDRGDEATLCAGRCLANATCSDIVSNASDTAYVRCVAGCSGADPDDFICASGDAYVPRAGVCDGVPQCPDGSDEADCGGGSDGGAE